LEKIGERQKGYDSEVDFAEESLVLDGVIQNSLAVCQQFRTAGTVLQELEGFVFVAETGGLRDDLAASG
jgi:hypothetical protein